MKIVAGSNGYNAEKVAEKIRANPALARNCALMYMTALNVGFGSEGCLVVINPLREFHRINENLNPLYRSTFDKPEFNPRWERGSVEHYEEVML